MVLFVVCVVGFVGSYLFGGGLDQLTLICCGAKDRELIVGAGEWWRLISAGFLHAHVVHLAVNLYALVALGPTVERLWGTRRFLIIYVAAVAAGNLASVQLTDAVSVGASGGIFGLFGAVVIFSTIHRQYIRPTARGRLLGNLFMIGLVNVALGISLPFIDNAAHAGGFVAGAIAALVLRPVPERRGDGGAADLAVRVLSVLAVVLTGWSLAMAVNSALSSELTLAARTELERRSVQGGHFSLFVPKSWHYEPPAGRQRSHVFRSRSGEELLGIYMLAPKDNPGAAAFAQRTAKDWTQRGATLLGRREATVAGLAAVELLFGRKTRRRRERVRVVIFATPADRLFAVTCICHEARYRLLHVIFDKAIQSIQPQLPVPTAAGAQQFWRRLTENPRDVDAHVLLAAFYRLEGRFDAAEQALRTAVALDPGHADAHDQLAHLYATAPAHSRRPKQAIRHAQRAVRAKPSTARYRATLAIAHEAAGQRDKALDAARKAAALAPDDATYADLVKRLASQPED